ncbi:MAG TPA: amino acid adenylation domain-containing protein [Longimicrobiaceae bacterium]|nr:amino acid adenylation domain-containing protein [Longimicrobiaceae bacterium]
MGAGRVLTYRELDAEAERLAAVLRARGAGPESRVALFMERGVELAVGLLGVLKAGAAYVPLDPGYPPERLRFLLEDSGAGVVVTRSALAGSVPDGAAAVLCLDYLPEGEGREQGARAHPESLAYAIYTSGSTGLPKGVMVTHRSLLCYAEAMRERLELSPADRFLQFASPSFDVMVEEVFPAWLSGAAVVFPGADLLDSPAELAGVLEAYGVTGLELPTAFWHEWVGVLEQEGTGLPPSVRFVIVGGERILPDRLRAWAGVRVPLVHVFGLTETTVSSTTLRLEAGEDGSVHPNLPVGHALPNVELRVLDAEREPAPRGVPGELYVGGEGVARGYLGRPDLTAERFVPDPFPRAPGARLYRTGDRVRRLADGSLEFLGRIDEQVKVRGFRIEPAEVEAVLAGHPAVGQAAVVVREDTPGDRRLVAYVVPGAGYAPEAGGLRRTVGVELWPSHGEYPVYDDLLYRAMADDTRRNAGYREALARVVPGKVAVDVGTGGEVVLARLCVEAGAKKVYAVERMEESFRRAQERVRELGLEDRVELIFGDAREVELPEPADVCVSELLGCIGGSEGAVAVLDAARRWLRPGGVMVPGRCVTRIAAVRLPDALHAAPVLEEVGGHYADRVLEVVGHPFDLPLCLRNLPADHVVSDSAVFEELDFSRPGGDTFRREVELRVERGGRIDGFVLWIRLYCGEELTLDSLRDECAWLPLFFPALYPGVEASAGDVLRVVCSAELSDDGMHPDYAAEGVLRRAGGGEAPFAYRFLHHGRPRELSAFHQRLFHGGRPRVRSAAGERVTVGELRDHLGAHLPAHMVPSAFVVLESLPLTANGKTDRRALPAPAEDRLRPGAYEAPRSEAEATLARIWGEVLRMERVGIHDSFFELGGDSILAIQVVSRARRAGLHLRPRDLFQAPTVARLSAIAAAAPAPSARPDRGAPVGEAPLLPVQRWFFAQEIPERHHWNLPLLLEVRRPVNPALLRDALLAVTLHHDALRFRYARSAAGEWTQRYAPPAEAAVPLERADLSHVPDGELAEEVERRCAAVQAGLDPERGPVLRALLLEPGSGRPPRLLLAAHHLVVDGVSWRIVAEDLQAAYEALERGVRPELPPKTTSFGEWATRLAEHAAGGGFDGELDGWTDERGWTPRPLPVDGPGPDTAGAVRTVSVALDARETEALLRDLPAAYRSRPDDALLAALARAFERWTGEPHLLVELEGHGREELFAEVDLSRTVGWLTSVHPVLLDVGGAAHAGEALRRVKEQLRAVPGRGIGYGALRWLGPDPGTRERLAALPRAEVSFNYLGRIDASAPEGALFALAGESPGADVSPRAPRAHLLEVNAAVHGGELRVEWRYGSLVHRRETVEALAEAYLAELRALVALCREDGAGGCTPSDFPLAGLDQAGVDALVGSGRDVEDVYPLAPMQEGMLFETLYAPESGVYVAQYVFRLAGELHEDAFLRAWRRVLERHPALRAGFVSGAADRPLQVVRRGAEPAVLREDRRGMAPAGREAALEAFLAEDRARGFDPARPPLTRLALFRDGGAEWTLVWTFHQALLDGWSLPIVFREVLAAYDAFREGREPSLPEAPPYREYLAWLARQDPARAEGFWREALDGFAVPTPLGVDRPGAAGAERGYGRLESTLPEALCDALQAAARRGELTVNTLVQGAWALLLSRYSGEEDVVFGTAVSGRPAELEGVEEMVGVFIATLPVRARVEPGEAVLPWLRALQERQAEAREHGHVPLSGLQRWSEVPAGTPLFESVLAYENYPVDGVLAGDRPLRIGVLAQREQSNYPLAVAVFPGRPLRIATTFDRARFDADAVERMLGHLRVALEGIAGDGGRPLGSVAILSDAERRALLAAGRAPASVPGPARCVHELFAEQAAASPDAVALAQGERTMTYGELELRANRLANHLRKRGVGPDVRVGVCLERSPEMVVAILAALKAGGAYVMLDPDYPAERLALMLADAGVRVLLTEEPFLGRLAGTGAEPVCLDRDADAIAREPGTAPRVEVTPEHLCYVIYTSGSTGRPKGTEVPHRSIPGFFRGVDYVRFDAEQTFLQHSSVSWDVLTLELWPALLTGARCVLYTGGSVEPAELGAQVRAHGVTTLWLSAAFFNLVVDTAPEVLAGVRQVMTGGEAVSLPHVRRALARYPELRLVNGYGPSECTVFATCYPVPGGFDAPAVPIGAPIGDRRVHVLARSLEPVPAGAVGEAYVGGPAVARGYLGRPELTAEKFVPDPFGEPGARLYRTGDRVRLRADRLLEFVGRMDTQVKVRGFRIEPGEVEAALLRHPGVREAVVVVREDVPGDRRLVAYLTGAADAAVPSAAELRKHLSGSLPLHLVPTAFVVLDALPLTPRGKTDRRALPAPEAAPSPDGEQVAPRTAAEQALADVWARVLRVDRVGVTDNFFEVGGDSILSIRVVTEARRAGLEVTPRDVFENPTVAALARVAGRTATARAEQGAVTGEAPLTPVQHWFFEQGGSDLHHANQALLLAPREPLDLPSLEGALAALVRHHDALRLRFRRGGEGWIQSHGPVEERVPVERVDLAGVPAADRAGALDRRATQVQASLDLGAGPLLRAALFDLGRGEQRLLLVVHHLAVDGVSWRVLLEDLEAAYRRIAAGLDADLPPKTTSYQHWSGRLAAHARSAAVRGELEYWTHPGRRVRPLPVDHPGGENSVASARAVTVSLNPDETEALLREVPTAYRTQINDVLLAALVEAMAGWTGEQRLLVDLEGHGREDLFADVDLSRTVGWFTAVHPMLLDAGSDPSPGERLKRVKEQLRAVPGKGIGYGLLRYLHPDEEVRGALRELPEPQVSFNYLGQFDQSFSDGALFALVDEPSGSAQGAHGLRHHLLELDARIEGGCLQVEWSYSAALHRPATVERLASQYLERLRALISHCRTEEPGGYTASDFALAGIDADTLSILESEILEEDLDLDPAGT